MIATRWGEKTFPPRASEPAATDSELVELMLLLPSVQAAHLEAAAHERGLTVGQMLRRIVRDFTDRAADASPARDTRLDLPD